MKKTPCLRDVYEAHARIKPLVIQTPLAPCPDLAKKTGARRVHLKLECLQNTGAFKIRGVANRILSLDDHARKKGVITFSTGNHGKAVAHAAAFAGIRAVVCLSEHVSPHRAEAIKALGAEVELKGRSQDEAEAHYHERVQASGMVPVVPFDDPMVIAGQGTIALEILAQLPDTQVLMVPLSGGGLLGGMAMAAKTINPGIHIVGLSLSRSPAMLESLKAGKPVAVEEKDSIAESLLGGIGFENHYTLDLIDKFVDEHLMITEEEIKDGMFYAFDNHRLIIEGAAALGLGAMLHEKPDLKGKKVVALVSGNNIESREYLDVINSRLPQPARG